MQLARFWCLPEDQHFILLALVACFPLPTFRFMCFAGLMLLLLPLLLDAAHRPIPALWARQTPRDMQRTGLPW